MFSLRCWLRQRMGQDVWTGSIWHRLNVQMVSRLMISTHHKQPYNLVSKILHNSYFLDFSIPPYVKTCMPLLCNQCSLIIMHFRFNDYRSNSIDKIVKLSSNVISYFHNTSLAFYYARLKFYSQQDCFGTKISIHVDSDLSNWQFIHLLNNSAEATNSQPK